VEELLAAWGIKMVKLAGYEADDIIGALAAATGPDLETLIVTSDRDILQLVGGGVKVLLTNRGVSDVAVMDEAAVKEKFGVAPPQIVDLKGLMGDKSDNIPGVPGVGEKTALKLLDEFGTLENILQNIDSLPGKRARELIRQNSDQALLSYKLATIVTEIPFSFSLSEFSFTPDGQKLQKIFQKLEFKSLLAKLGQILAASGQDALIQQTEKSGESTKATPQMKLPAAQLVTEAAIISNFYALHPKIACFPIIGGEPPLVSLEAMALSAADKTFFVPKNSPAWQEVLSLLADETKEKITYDAKVLWNACQNQKIQLKNVAFDIMLAAYLLEPSEKDYSLQHLAAVYGSYESHGDFALIELKDYAGWAGGVIYGLEPVFKERLAEAGLAHLFSTVEMPLIEVLASMECCGIKIDTRNLKAMAAELALKLNSLVKEIYQQAGEEFNLNSPKQLGHILFEKLGLPTQKKTKTGYSTDVEVLEKLAFAHPIIDLLLEYRTLAKLKSTYLDGLEPLVRDATGRIHTTFNQMVTETGRLSSSEPNLQNIPIRTEIGKKIRELFIPDSGFSCLMAADYSQIELRILAHISADAKLIEAFSQNEDIHTRTAAEVFNVPPSEVTGAMRTKAKAVNFGIVYGISDYGLARDLKVSRKEAGEYIENYFAKYQGVKNYIEQVTLEAKKDGYVTTIFGRRRFLPDINSSNFNRRSFAERTAMNTPIQGAAADIIKMAMVKVYQVLKESALKSRLILQVHDELVLEIFPGEEETVAKIVKYIMEKIVTLNIPVTAEVASGENWAQAK
jgi:DNA polymerase-1